MTKHVNRDGPARSGVGFVILATHSQVFGTPALADNRVAETHYRESASTSLREASRIGGSQPEVPLCLKYRDGPQRPQKRFVRGKINPGTPA
jgi:hypothetical protein